MNDGRPPTAEGVPLSESDRIDLICDAFERALLAGGQPRIEGHLGEADDPSRGELLEELLAIEIEFRRGRGESPAAAEYLARFPQERAAVDSAFAPARTRRGTRQAAEGRHSRQRFPIRINCPHCRGPIAVVDDDSGEEVHCPSCGSSFRLDPDRTMTWRPGNLPKLGRFELLEAVGRGAFGTVYKARDPELHRMVAIKVPRSGTFSTQEDEDRFVREARSVAQLSHTGIVPVFEVGRSGAFPYIVSEYVDGITLANALTGRQLAFREAAELVAEIAGILEHAHRQGVVHRDLKPANIILQSRAEAGSSGSDPRRDSPGRESSARRSSQQHTSSFRPRVLDFGLARRAEGEITVTVDGQVLGTPAYMSPEQARGEGHAVDGRSDVYSLGVILYELLTGELPFRGNARMLLHQVLSDEPLAPRRVNDRIPADLETICLKCLEKEPARRYQSAGDLAEELWRFLRGEPIHARPIGRLGRTWRWCRRHPARSGLVAASLAAILLAGIGLANHFAYAEAERQRRIADLNAAEAERNRRSALQQMWEAINARDGAEQQRVLAADQRQEALHFRAVAEQQRELAKFRQVEVWTLEERRAEAVRAIDRLAWKLVRRSEPERDTLGYDAVTLSSIAVNLHPDGPYWNTLAIAHCQAGDWEQAIEAAKQFDDVSEYWLSFNEFVLAMAKWQLDQKEVAREHYEQAVRRMKVNTAASRSGTRVEVQVVGFDDAATWLPMNERDAEDLLWLRAEAAALLGIDLTADRTPN